MNENETIILKKKCNLQLEKIKELQEQIAALNTQLLQGEDQRSRLEEELKKNQEGIRIPEEKREAKGEETTELMLFVDAFCKIVKRILEDRAFIPYKNYTKNSSRYCKIEKELFELYVKDLAPFSSKKFFDFCIDLHFLKAETDRKCVYSNDKIRIYFVSRALVRALGGLDAAAENLCR